MSQLKFLIKKEPKRSKSGRWLTNTGQPSWTSITIQTIWPEAVCVCTCGFSLICAFRQKVINMTIDSKQKHISTHPLMICALVKMLYFNQTRHGNEGFPQIYAGILCCLFSIFNTHWQLISFFKKLPFFCIHLLLLFWFFEERYPKCDYCGQTLPPLSCYICLNKRPLVFFFAATHIFMHILSGSVSFKPCSQKKTSWTLNSSCFNPTIDDYSLSLPVIHTYV